MRSFCRGKYLQRQTDIIDDDLEMQRQANVHDQRSESGRPWTGEAIVSSSIDNSPSDPPNRGSHFLETFLTFYYYIGVSPFRVDRTRTVKSNWLSKLLCILITLVSVVYIIFSVRRLAFRIDTPEITQQEKASSYIGLVFQFCLLLLHACVCRMIWEKQDTFVELFRSLDTSKILTTIKKSSLGNFVVISVCTLTVSISLTCTLGGLAIMDRHQKWSFFEILSHQEDKFFLGLKQSYDEADFNDTSGGGNNVTDDDDNSGIFLNDGDLETIIFGSVGLAVDFCQHVFSLFSHDCFLLSTISLWISTKSLRDKLKLWKNRIQRKDSDCEEGRHSRKDADDVVNDYKELSLLSKQINRITNSFLPTLVMTNIIMMSYFMYSLITRQWYFALYLALKLCKVWVAIYFAMKTSKVAEGYYSWFISKDVQELLDISCKKLQRIFAEMKESPVGNGSSLFYIDTRFLLSTLGIISTYFYMVTGIGT